MDLQPLLELPGLQHPEPLGFSGGAQVAPQLSWLLGFGVLGLPSEIPLCTAFQLPECVSFVSSHSPFLLQV